MKESCFIFFRVYERRTMASTVWETNENSPILFAANP